MSEYGNAIVSIKNIVDDLPSTVSWKQVVYEAVTNSIQAGATNIKINFTSNTMEMENPKKYIDSIVIEDDGEGFVQKNLDAFKEYKTQNKRELGCKGIGRFLYLKVFNKVHIDSLDKSIDFEIDKDIEPKNTKKIDKTLLILEHPKNKILIEYDNFKENIQEHFIAYFKLKKDLGIQINIETYENNELKNKISSEDIPKFKDKDFKVGKHKFKIHYTLDNIQNNEGYYCAGSRVVKKNSELSSDKKLKIFQIIDIVYLISSRYLDDNVVKETRDDFTIHPKRKNQEDLFHSLSWEDIQEAIRNEIKTIAKENDINIDEIAKESLSRAISEAPYLGYYIKRNEEVYDYETLIINAEKEFEKDKDFLRGNSEKMDDEYHQKLTKVTHSELAEYMFDRQKIIKKLKNLTDNNVIEEEIHNIFMKKRTNDDKENYTSNNLWLFDDRFMTYDKLFSEEYINRIFPELVKNTDRIDLLSISSNTYNKNDITDIVIIELKRPKNIITPAGAEEQLLKYARYVNQAKLKNKVRIWTYAFLKFNEETDGYLDDKSYNKIPTHSEYPIYYRYYENRNTIINFMDYAALSSDAENRHKTFMKILSGDRFRAQE